MTDFAFIPIFNIFILFFIESDTCHHFIDADVGTNRIQCYNVSLKDLPNKASLEERGKEEGK
jgi:hypothetical protein